MSDCLVKTPRFLRLRWNETITCCFRFYAMLLPTSNHFPFLLHNQIWVRNYQIMEEAAATAKEAHAQKKLTGQTHSTSLIEIGPRFVLNPIRIFRGSFGGQTLWQNDEFVSPNVIRAQQKREKGEQYVRRKGAERSRKKRKEAIIVPDDPLADVF
jgi:ribosome biogenesis protein BRX1